jgi:hypothetical protein
MGGMTEVFALIDDMGYDGQHLLGVFSTLEKAQEHAEARHARRNRVRSKGFETLRWRGQGVTLTLAITNAETLTGYVIHADSLDAEYDWDSSADFLPLAQEAGWWTST